MIEVVPDTRPELEAELAVPCPVCVAKVGERCASLVNAAKYLPISHAGRRRLAQTVKESQQS